MMFVQSVVNLSPSFSEERPERKSERERELLRFKSETLSLTPRVFACSSFAFPTAFNKLFLIEWFRVLNPNRARQLWSLPSFSRHCARAQNVVKPPRLTPNRHLFSKKKRERDEDSLENTVRFRASFQFFFAFVFLSQISLVPFALLRGGFFQSRFGFLSLVPSLLRESDADGFDALFSLSLCVCVCLFLSLWCVMHKTTT